MLKIFSICVATVLVLSSGAFAIPSKSGLGQTECFNMIGENQVSIDGWCGSATSGNMSTVDQEQKIGKLCNIGARQSESSMLTQSADASGKCGDLDVYQLGTVDASQEQLASKICWKALTTQEQSLDVEIGQTVEKDGGYGTASGAQGSISEQSQSIKDRGIIMNASQCIGAIQYANVSGLSDAFAGNYTSVTAEQTQKAN